MAVSPHEADNAEILHQQMLSEAESVIQYILQFGEYDNFLTGEFATKILNVVDATVNPYGREKVYSIQLSNNILKVEKRRRVH